MSGCARPLGICMVLILLAGLGCCALLNSAQLRSGFPGGINYDRVLAYDAPAGFRESCVFIAYRLDKTSAARLLRNRGAPDASASGITPDRNYEAYSPTSSLIRRGDDWVKADGRVEHLYALGADGGCEHRDYDLPSATQLLDEPGNFASAGNGGEGLSVVSPSRGLVLFLYFG